MIMLYDGRSTVNRFLLTILVTCCLIKTCRQQLIPRKALFSGNNYEEVAISDDGRWLTYKTAYENVVNVYAKRLPDGVDYPLTRVKGRGVAGHFWLHDNQTVVYAVDNDGDENWVLRSVDVETRIERTLTPSKGVTAKLLASSPQVPDTIIIGMNNRNPRYHDAYQLKTSSGRMTLMFRNDFYATLVFDRQLRLRMGANETNQASLQFFLLEPEQGTKPQSYTAKPYKLISLDDGATKPLGFHSDGKVLYWLSNEGRDLTAVVAENLEKGKSKVLYEGQLGDIGFVLEHPMTGEPLIATETYAIPTDHVLMPEIQLLHSRVKNSFPGTSVIEVTSMSLDLRKWVVGVSSDLEPVSYYICDVSNETYPCQLLFHSSDGLRNYTMSPMKSVEVTTRDNLTEVCFFTFPYKSVNKETGFPRYPLPTVVYVHGGPWAQDKYGFNADRQLLANRGYAVIQCNYRGSTGYGKKMLSAANGEWGRKMQYDLLDAVQWAVERNYTLKEKVAIFGASYGGYAVLASLSFTPDTFACGIDVVGPSNLISFLLSIPATWKPLYCGLVSRLGASPDTEEGRNFLKSRSPLFYADRIKKPLMIAHGANDPRVKQNESDQIVEALQARNTSFTYVLFPTEGHGMKVPENQLTLWSFVDRFLAQCLGGKAEPVGSDMQGSIFTLRTLNSEAARNLS